MNAPSASLTMKYQQSQRMTLTAMGNYFGTRSSDKLVDLDMMGGEGVLTWELEPVRDWKPQLSLEGGYNLQVNRLMPSAQTENLSGLSPPRPRHDVARYYESMVLMNHPNIPNMALDVETLRNVAMEGALRSGGGT